MPTINLTDTANVVLGRNGKYGNMPVNLARFSDTVHTHIYDYGLRQILNDAMASKTDEEGNALSPEAIVAKAQKRLDNLYEGKFRATREGGERTPTDPIEAEAYKLAKEELAEIFKPAMAQAPKGTKQRLLWAINRQRAAKGAEAFESVSDVVDTYLAGPKGDAVMKRAKRNVADRQKAAEQVNLEDLGI